MKLTKQRKAEILDLYEAFWGSLFYADIDMYSYFLDEDYRLIGTTEQEFFFSRAEAVRFLKATADQLAGNLERRNSRHKIEVIENLVFITDQFDAYVLIDDKWSFYEKTRVTTLLHEKKEGWKIIQQHFSFPDNKAGSGQTIGLEKITKENLQLKEAIRRRTIELELKNKELEIEFSLERVRAVAMGMKQPDDMLEICEVITRELISLGIARIRNVQTAIIDTAKGTYQNYEYYQIAREKLVTTVAYKEHPIIHAFVKRMVKNPEGFYARKMQGEELKNWLKYQSMSGQFVDPTSTKAASLHYYFFSIGSGALGITAYAPLLKEAIGLFKRFRNVFQLAFARFVDIQQAEIQAREAKIELALERVRAGAMAMRQSDELGQLIFVLYQELTKLDAKLDRCFIMIVHPENQGITWWMAGQEGLLAENGFFIQSNQHASHLWYLDSWKKRRKRWKYLLEGKEKREWDRFGFAKTELTRLPDPVKKFMAGVKKIHLCGSSDQFGSLVTGSFDYLSDEHQEIISRFAVAFNQAYIRFLDLQKAEAQVREAQIEAALERVRSRTLAMQRSDELAETAAVLFQQLILLGIEPNRLYISIIKTEQGETEFWITDEDGSKVSTAFAANMNENVTFQRMYEGWEKEEKSLVIDMQGEELKQYFRHLSSLGVPFKGGLEQKRRVQEIAYFNHGFIGIASPEKQPVATLELLERFAAVFNLTFTRFNDLQIAEAHAAQSALDLIAIKEAKQKAEEALLVLQATQKQLVQSEKMASLGELTAGIAHEIQNPLNFVNNFSEVSNELISEMVDEVDKGNTDEVKAIARDVQQNLEKILHHGKRADGIVKGMLQHSRTSSGMKEPTDINALADEYLRLAYHGLRAKDKSFNATLKTEFDDTIGKVNIIPQDIGRVILNLITNAFYACTERSRSTAPLPSKGGGSDPDYRHVPTVWVSTKKERDTVIISVQDNGPGIPEEIRDKIFQPFFTTKPTGQGTGLGLSLSYDIVKAHGGEIKLETKEGEGTTFIIQLPDSFA